MTGAVNSRAKGYRGWRHLLRFCLAVLGLICCYRFIEEAARTGMSRLFSATAIIQSRVEPADEAVRLAPRDPEAHYTRALALVNLERLNEAVAELEQATQLRPHHYYEWLDLGVTLDRLGDQPRADAALRESIRLAPYFAQPRWQLGSLLYREARYKEAFEELRLATESNPSLVEGLLGLAWEAGDGDVGTMEALVQAQSRKNHLELANFFAKRGKGSDAARQVSEAGAPGDEGERALLHQTISRLLASQLFFDAYAAWAITHTHTVDTTKGPSQFLNGDFVEPIAQDDPGFGWQVLATPQTTVSIDLSGPSPGSRSVRVDFSGDSAPSSPLIHQLVLLQSKNRYTLNFMAKAENLVSGGPPLIFVLDAASSPAKILGQSQPLSPGTSEWSPYRVDFSTGENNAAVTIVLERMVCRQSPCPIFGRLWLSNFSLLKT